MEGEGEKVERANKEKISNCYPPGYPRVKCSLADSHSDSRTKKRTYIYIHTYKNHIFTKDGELCISGARVAINCKYLFYHREDPSIDI